MKKHTTISVFNLKGGVGKTTTTINLAYNLSQMGMSVLVVDMDPQVNTTPIFQASENGKNTIKTLMDNKHFTSKSVYRSKYKNIDLIKGDTKLREEYAPDTLCSVWPEIKEQYDCILLDCRPSFESLTQNAVNVSDMVLTPVVLDRFCLDNLALVKELLEQFGENVTWKIFANKVRSVRSQMSIYQEVMMGEYPFLNSCITDRAAISNALAYRKPLILHQKNSPATFDFLQLANEIGGILNHG